jgi:hypothetical protein
LSCPNTPRQALTAENSETILNQAARDFVNNSNKGVHIEKNTLIISQLYSTYKVDFGGFDETVLAHLNRFSAPKLAKQLQSFNRFTYLKEDWRLNDYARFQQDQEFKTQTQASAPAPSKPLEPEEEE